MLERFTRSYCGCVKWRQAEWKEKNLLLKQYPSQCPYCHEKLSVESTASDVRILFEGVATTLDAPSKLSLAELKELLNET